MISESEFTVKGHGVHTAYLEMARALRARPDIDLVVNSPRQSDITHAHSFGPYAWWRMVRARRARVISVHVVPDSLIGSIKGARAWMFAMKWWLRQFYNHADLCLACSGSVAKVLADELHIDPTKVRVHYNTIDMAQYTPKPGAKLAARRCLGFSEDAFIVLGNGQLQPRKRLDSFIGVARLLPQVQFCWIGGIPFKALGSEASKMEHMVANAPANVMFTGIIELEDVAKYLAAADAFFLPSAQENHPMCVLEAAGAGLPIVLRDIPEYADTFADAVVTASDDAGFAAAIAKLRDDPDFYDAGVAGAAKLAGRFDSAAGVDRLMVYYDEAMAIATKRPHTKPMPTPTTTSEGL